MLPVLLLLLTVTRSDDLLVRVPNYPRNFTPRVWAGYLPTNSSNRKLHYIFMESKAGEGNTDPITLWMNGGPGCSSKLGFIQQIAPYYLPFNTPYQQDQELTANPYTWHNLSNLLFIDSPAGVGFSINQDPDYQYNDSNSAEDVLSALVSFFTNRTQYSNRTFYIAGESYAGKYIPDLANEIYIYNSNNPGLINLRGILVGNGVMTFEGGSLEQSQIGYMVDHDFIDPELLHYWRDSCQQDEESAGCQFFYTRFDDVVGDINPYNVYGYCYTDVLANQSEKQEKTPKLSQRMLLKIASQYRARRTEYGDGDCQYDHGLQTYFTKNSDIFNSLSTVPFSACNGTIFESYTRTETGSMDAYKWIFNRGDIKVWMFNGDWDDVVPFRDTLKNLEKLGLKPSGDYKAWTVDGQHAGFYREYPGMMFYLVKGAGHEVPQYQRQRAYEMFKAFLSA